MEVLEGLDNLWFFSNVLSTSRVSVDDHRSKVHEKVWSWLQDSVEASRDEVVEEECTEEAEQSTLLAMVMSSSEPSSSRLVPPPPNPVSNSRSSDCGGRKKGKSRRKLKSVKNELFERKRNVLAEIECDYVRQLERCRISDANEFYPTRFGKPTAKANVV